MPNWSLFDLPAVTDQQKMARDAEIRALELKPEQFNDLAGGYDEKPKPLPYDPIGENPITAGIRGFVEGAGEAVSDFIPFVGSGKEYAETGDPTDLALDALPGSAAGKVLGAAIVGAIPTKFLQKLPGSTDNALTRILKEKSLADPRADRYANDIIEAIDRNPDYAANLKIVAPGLEGPANIFTAGMYKPMAGFSGDIFAGGTPGTSFTDPIPFREMMFDNNKTWEKAIGDYIDSGGKADPPAGLVTPGYTNRTVEKILPSIVYNHKSLDNPRSLLNQVMTGNTPRKTFGHEFRHLGQDIEGDLGYYMSQGFDYDSKYPARPHEILARIAELQLDNPNLDINTEIVRELNRLNSTKPYAFHPGGNAVRGELFNAARVLGNDLARESYDPATGLSKHFFYEPNAGFSVQDFNPTPEDLASFERKWPEPTGRIVPPPTPQTFASEAEGIRGPFGSNPEPTIEIKPTSENLPPEFNFTELIEKLLKR